MTTETIIRWLFDHRKKITILAIAGIPVVLAFSFLSENAFIFIEADTDIKNQKIETYTTSDAETKKAGGLGLMITSKKTKGLIVTAGSNIKTQTTIDIPWYGFAQKTVRLIYDKNAEKIAFHSTTAATCATYGPQSDKLSYYTCKKPKTLVQYQTPDNKPWFNQKIADIYYSNGRAEPYMGGVIGIAHVEAGDAQHSGDIVATTEAGKAISYTAPEETDISTINTARLYTDIGNSENKNFVLVDAVGNIYLGKPTQGSGVEYKQIPKPANYHTDYNQTLCDVSGDSVSCYRGRSAVGDLPEGLNFNSVAGYSIVTASFGSDSTSVANINGDTFGLDGFYVANGKLFGKSYKKLFYFEKKGDSYETREISQNVDFVAGGQKLYFIQNNGVFELDNETSDFHQIFHSNNIMPKSIYAVDGKTFIIASTSYDPTTTYAYLLNNEPDTNPGKRLIDIFPLSSKALSNTYSNDLVGDTLSINLIVTYRRNSPQQSIDGGELASQKESVLDALRAYDSGINEDNIQFVY